MPKRTKTARRIRKLWSPADKAAPNSPLPKFLQSRKSLTKTPAEVSRAAKAKADSDALEGWLNKKAKQDAEILALADKISQCSNKHPCLSGACQRCLQRVQSGLSSAIKSFVKGRPKSEKIALLTIVGEPPAIPLGKLAECDVANLDRRIKYALKKAGVIWAIGGLDFSQNEHKTGRYAPFWCPHFHGVVATGNEDRLRKKLTKLFPSTDAVPRPTKLITTHRQKCFATC
jgi:hypothetical protein